MLPYGNDGLCATVSLTRCSRTVLRRGYGIAAFTTVIGGGIQAPSSADWSGQNRRSVSSNGPVGVGSQLLSSIAGGVFWMKMSIDPSGFGFRPVSLPTSYQIGRAHV